MSLGLYSYLGAAIAYGFFAFLLIFSWRRSMQGKLLFVSMLVSTCWAFASVKIALHDESYLLAYQSLELLRYTAWYVFLLKLFDIAYAGDRQKPNSYQKFNRWALPLTVGFSVFLLINEILAAVFSLPGQFVLGITGNVLLALAGLAILEQLYRNMSTSSRWATKYMFLGAGGIFAYDFYLYADALLFRRVDQSLWEARGFVHLVVVPLLAIASARNKNWSLNIFVSRDIILNTTTILAGGFYLLAMAAVGYYLREFGGSWGRVGQVMFITLAVVFLFVVLSSSQLRAQIKVFLGKHFYKNKYDYRVEWLRITDDLNENTQNKNHYQIAIQAIAHITDARAGALWLVQENGGFVNADSWHCKPRAEIMRPDSPLMDFLERTGFVVNIREIKSHADEYNGLQLPQWLDDVEQPWLIVPLHGIETLLGFIVLANPLLVRSINWEDHDLLKIAAKQIASHLIVLQTSAQLAEAKQFEVFSRLSAYMVHDLKNIAAELELITINAKKHMSKPEFVADAFETVENAAADINRLLSQLRNRHIRDEKKVLLDLKSLLADVVATKQHQLPAPSLLAEGDAGQVFLEKGRLANVLAHLIDNAQQSIADDGEITITLSIKDNSGVIEIKDNGCGMDETFIRDRLFSAFDTTKGNAGMGIGMFESREFMRQSGGDIFVQSEPGKGTIISLQIPLSGLQGNK